MATQIEIKVQQLKKQHFDLGVQQTGEIDCGYGGRMQTFSNTTIYYHPVMGSEAREVHGGIRTKYLALGGHDSSPSWGQRLFGFPLTDEINSDDSMCRVSRFEWGAIYWTFGCTWVYGEIYKKYLSHGGEKGRLGYPISEPTKVSDGVAVFFEHGLMYQGKRSFNAVIEINYSFPQLGHPWLMPSSEFNNKEVISFVFNTSQMNANIAGHLVEELFNGRIFLKQTGNNYNEMPLKFDFTDMKQLPGPSPSISKFSSCVRIQAPASIKQSRLYDIILKFPDRSHTIAPHSLYFKDDWDGFKFIHATDIHVSRRLDGFRKFFSDRSMHDAIRNFNNFNDNFREFIRYANKLHTQGLIDFIVLTGDLVDYVFEDGGKHYYNNNFVYFENIIRGLTGKPDKVQNDELLVPLFTSLGNHDYRIRPYYPIFTVDIPLSSDRTMEQFGPMNITKDEAKYLTEHHLGIKGKISSDTAISMINPDKENSGGNLNHYFRSINRDASYEVKLGNHSLIMIDGKWDAGAFEDKWDALWHHLGWKGEAEDNFTEGSPDSVGFNGTELTMISRALQKDGLAIICMHAPVINPKHSEYSWFLREYLRSASPQPFKKEMLWYLYRRDPDAFTYRASDDLESDEITIDLTIDKHTGWSRQHTFYFHEGNGGDLLDYAVMRGSQEYFLKLITGVQHSPRPADLILSGHGHKNFECRVLWNATAGKFQFSHEFFTENPSVYYHSYDMNTGDRTSFTMGKSQRAKFIEDNELRIHIQVTDQAAGNDKPEKNSSGVWSLKTKPYPSTLESQQDNAHCKWWWSNVKPLLVQTAALGPSDYLRSPEHQPDFRGCRHITVNDGVIEKIKHVKHEDMENYQPGNFFDPHILENKANGLVK